VPPIVVWLEGVEIDVETKGRRWAEQEGLLELRGYPHTAREVHGFIIIGPFLEIFNLDMPHLLQCHQALL
jgi:hypothetical protein